LEFPEGWTLFCGGVMIFSGTTNFLHLFGTPIGLNTCSNKICNASSTCPKEM